MPMPQTFLAPFALVLAIAAGPLAVLVGQGPGLGTWAPVLVGALGVFAVWIGLSR